MGNSQLARHQVHGHGITQPQVGPGSPRPRSGYVRRSRMCKLQGTFAARMPWLDYSSERPNVALSTQRKH